MTHDCSDADIRKYYRRQALLVHPDKSRCPGADEAFKILQRAFQLVGAPVSRLRRLSVNDVISSRPKSPTNMQTNEKQMMSYRLCS